MVAQEPGTNSLNAPLAPAETNRFHLESVGARMGVPLTSESAESFLQAEAFSNWAVPVRWDLGAQWEVGLSLDLALGWLGGGSKSGVIGSFGPVFELRRGPIPVAIHVGSSPTLLSEHDYPSKDFGGDFQFTSHAGIDWDFARHFRLSYQFQHMSNAGLYSHNPGLNLHMFGLSYVF
jgi:hypothetical protein